jgi:hypothetical protein
VSDARCVDGKSTRLAWVYLLKSSLTASISCHS